MSESSDENMPAIVNPYKDTGATSRQQRANKAKGYKDRTPEAGNDSENVDSLDPHQGTSPRDQEVSFFALETSEKINYIKDRKLPLIFAGATFVLCIIIVATSIAIKHHHLPIYGYTDFVPRWGNIILYIAHIPGLVVLPIMFYQKDYGMPMWMVYMVYAFFPAMAFCEMIASITSKFSPSTFHLFMIIPYLLSYAIIFFMKNTNTSKIRNEIISIFLLANILSIGSRVSSITQEIFLSNYITVPYIKYDSLFVVTIAAGGIFAAFSGAISAVVLFTLFWISLFFSTFYPTFGSHIILIVFVLFGIANIVIKYRFNESDSKWLTPHNYNRRATYLVASGFMAGYLVSMDVVCAMYTSQFSYIAFFLTGIFVLMYFLAIFIVEWCVIASYVIFFISTFLTAILAMIFTDRAGLEGYIGVAFLDIIAQLGVFQFFIFFFGHITSCPHVIYMPMLFLVCLMSYIMRYGFISPSISPELAVSIAFILLFTVLQVFVFKAGGTMRQHPLVVVSFFFVVIGILEIIALVLIYYLMIAAFYLMGKLCKCGFSCLDTMFRQPLGYFITDSNGQVWEIVEE